MPNGHTAVVLDRALGLHYNCHVFWLYFRKLKKDKSLLDTAVAVPRTFI